MEKPTALVAQMVKRLSTMRETWVRSLGWEDPLEKASLVLQPSVVYLINLVHFNSVQFIQFSSAQLQPMQLSKGSLRTSEG